MAVACASESSSANGWTTTDGAGIMIVTNRSPEWPDGPQWTISAEPTLDMAAPSRIQCTPSTRSAASGCYSDGNLFVVSGPGYGINSPSGFFRPDFAAFRFPADGSPPDSLGAWPGSETWVKVVDHSVSVLVPLFPHSTCFAATATVIWVGSNEQYQIEKLSHDDRTRMIVRLANDPVRLTDAMVRDERDRRLDRIEQADFRRRLRAEF